MHVLVAGSIAAGKSTLTRALAAALQLPAKAEGPERNPFLERFYADTARWALASQLWFSFDSARMHAEINQQEGGVQDHSIYENVFAFGAVLADRGYLTADEWELLQRITEPLIEALPPPTVVVLLEASPECLLERIRARGRDYESGIDLGYLEALNHKRSAYFERWERAPVLRVDSEAVDFRDEGRAIAIARRVEEHRPPGTT